MPVISDRPLKKNYQELTEEIEKLKKIRTELLHSLDICRTKGADETSLRCEIWTNNYLTMKADVSRNWQ
ncbi:MAG: hypothetical protein JWM99_4533 [Verrucomicrobiales bacterium]|nr:hypothetical protein [Verrucomicrobiales bacterium]